MQQATGNFTGNNLANIIHIIPVVVHVVYYNSVQNVSDAQIQSQIDVLNEDFSRTNADKINTPGPFAAIASATDFRFCLATRDPNGALTNGIERRQTSTQVFQPNNSMKSYSSGGLDAWDVDRYLNIWVCDLGGQILGYGDLPSMVHTNTYGVVIHYTAFGRMGTATAPYQLGRTCTHEISHCFDLYHVFSELDSCQGTDYVNDTPEQFEATFRCHGFPYADFCSPNYPGIMFMNYMDYSDDGCMNMFSEGQAARMFSAINTFYPTLLTSNGCLVDGIESVTDLKFSIYPNPSPGFLSLDLFTSINISREVNVKITDVLGKIVYEKLFSNNSGHLHQLDLHELNNGIYFVTVINENSKRTERIALAK